MLTTQVADAAVRAVNSLTKSPATGIPLQFALSTGDATDNCQYTGLPAPATTCTTCRPRRRRGGRTRARSA
jgi:hypothetical protein